jgi:uncharacterized membrane protein YraQ (UPF0718 family)
MELSACLLALVLGPLAYQLSRAKLKTYSFVDGLVLVAVGGLVLFEILPEQVSTLGVWVVLMALGGFLFPHLIEVRLDSLPVSPRTIFSGLILLGMCIHQVLDGAALHPPGAGSEPHAVSHLGAAVILHQLPKGFLLWELARKAAGLATALLVIGGLLVATTVGYFLGIEVLGLLETRAVGCFQAFIAGGLLHVVFHHVPGAACGAPRGERAFWSGAGALVAVAVLIWLPRGHFVQEASSRAHDFQSGFLALAFESAVPILVGLVAAGLLQAFVPAGPLSWFHGRNRLTQALRGVVLGLPLPICSCGVTPVYHTLIRRSVPAAAAVAFLIATPEIGFDSFFLSLRFLGWEVTAIRLGMAFLIAVTSGCVLARVLDRVRPGVDLALEPLEGGGGKLGFRARCRRALDFGLFDLVDQIGPWLVAGLALAALAEPYLDPEWFATLPPGLDVLLLALVGLPIYVCASGATPLAAVLMGKGVSTGAVLAFLITGPTTNVTTFGILERLHGLWRAVALPVTVFILAVGLGLAVNAWTPAGRAPLLAELAAEPHSSLDIACALVLAVLLALSVLRLGPREFLARLGVEKDADESGGTHGEKHAAAEKHAHECAGA